MIWIFSIGATCGAIVAVVSLIMCANGSFNRYMRECAKTRHPIVCGGERYVVMEERQYGAMSLQAKLWRGSFRRKDCDEAAKNIAGRTIDGQICQ